MIRNKKLISTFAIIFFSFAFLISISKRKIWQGEFDIVLSNINLLEIISSAPKFSGNLNFSSTKLRTEVGILNSQSVLMPAFKFLKKEKSKIYKNKKDSLLFNDWIKQNLKLDLKRGTAILNVSYKDKDKNLIIPVLEKISYLYKDYSLSKEKKVSEQTKGFLEEQIKIYKKKTKNSFAEVQNYSLENDLSEINFYQDENINKMNSNLSFLKRYNRNFQIKSLLDFQRPPELDYALSIYIPNISTENSRVSYLNSLKSIDEQIKIIGNFNDGNEVFKYFAKSIPELAKENLLSKIEDIEEKLKNISLKNGDNKNTIMRLTKERDLITESIKDRIIGVLKAQRIEIEAKMIANSRPKDVILKYSELIKQAVRDESVLIDLENQLRLMSLKETKIFDSSKLIKKPILLEKPISPNRKKYALIGLIIGFFVGSIVAFCKEKVEGFVIESKILEKKFLTKVISQINLKEDKYGNNKISYVREFLKIDSKQISSIFILGDLEMKDLRKFKKILFNPDKNNDEIKLIDLNCPFEKFIKAENKILLANLATLKYKDIELVNDSFKDLNLELNGILLLND